MLFDNKLTHSYKNETWSVIKSLRLVMGVFVAVAAHKSTIFILTQMNCCAFMLPVLPLITSSLTCHYSDCWEEGYSNSVGGHLDNSCID